MCRHFNAPLIVAGDVFHKPNNPAELVNFVIDYWPKVETFAIPGNHDLPYHQLRNLKKSSYYTLMKSDRIINLHEVTPIPVDDSKRYWNIYLHPFPWGRDIHPCPANNFKSPIHVAVVHAYIWTDAVGYIPGIKPDRATNLSSYSKELAGYDAAVFGDNHIGFVARTKTGVPVMNCGGFYRAKANERTYQPKIGLLQITSGGLVVFWQVKLGWQEYWEEDAAKLAARTAEKFGDALDLEELVDLLEEDADGQLDFKQVVLTYAKKNIDPLMRDVLLRCIHKD